MYLVLRIHTIKIMTKLIGYVHSYVFLNLHICDWLQIACQYFHMLCIIMLALGLKIYGDFWGSFQIWFISLKLTQLNIILQVLVIGWITKIMFFHYPISACMTIGVSTALGRHISSIFDKYSFSTLACVQVNIKCWVAW